MRCRERAGPPEVLGIPRTGREDLDDLAGVAGPSSPPLGDLVTIGITAFRRPLSLCRLRESIRRSYPDCRVLVQDTGSNLSWARNQLARAVETPFLLLCEDDFEFIGPTRIEPLAE